ncbi:hypothetical protein BH11VER1_BH11VER1_12990 [soil metagenome]
MEIRPVPAVAVTGMWYEDERFLGSDWMVGARLELPFEGGDLGDGKGFWGRIGDAFKPRRRHLAERLAEPVRRQNAAIHLGNSTQQKSKVVSNKQSSSTQVISQTQQQVILGPGPSGTEFSYVSGGTLTLTQTGGGGQQTVNGNIFLNQLRQSVFVPDDGSTPLLISRDVSGTGGQAVVISNQIGTPNLVVTPNQVVTPNLAGSTITLSSNDFLTNPSVGTPVNLVNVGLTQLTYASGGTLTLSGGGTSLPFGNPGLSSNTLFTSAIGGGTGMVYGGTLILTGGGSIGGGTIIKAGVGTTTLTSSNSGGLIINSQP